MINLVPIIQAALDTRFADEKLYTYWQSKSETAGEADEYIVFSLAGNQDVEWADNKPYINSASAAVRYFYRREKLHTYAGRTAVQQRTADILSTLDAAGFYCEYGAFDAGEIDGNGYLCSVMEVEYIG